MVLDLECQGNQAGLDAGIIGLNVWSGFEPAINAPWPGFTSAHGPRPCPGPATRRGLWASLTGQDVVGTD